MSRGRERAPRDDRRPPLPRRSRPAGRRPCPGPAGRPDGRFRRRGPPDATPRSATRTRCAPAEIVPVPTWGMHLPVLVGPLTTLHQKPRPQASPSAPKARCERRRRKVLGRPNSALRLGSLRPCLATPGTRGFRRNVMTPPLAPPRPRAGSLDLARTYTA
ncbi:MAG: hypothetical protein E6G48_03560 [Actinobacteria bacterium]|nr:MAG: hypothetical protein E6G48_03560 [Actinomycetota bacterium]